MKMFSSKNYFMIINSCHKVVDISTLAFHYEIDGYIPTLKKHCSFCQYNENGSGSKEGYYFINTVVNIETRFFFFKKYTVLGSLDEYYHFLDEPDKSFVEESIKKNKKKD